MLLNKIQVQKTARYYTQGNSSSNEVWILLHGYGMLASQMIDNLNLLNHQEIYVVAPEGLSRFYWKGFDGNVVASWMTKEDREDEIIDYIKYLNQLINELNLSNKQINILGFSQGVATMSRWIEQLNIPLNKIVFWAGEPPSNIDYKKFETYCNQLYFVYGTNDLFMSDIQIEKINYFFSNLDVDIKYLTFEGKHELNESLFKEMLL